MTIKQQGGIFGRNPTFNEVDATDITTESLSLLKNNPFVRLDDSDTDNNGEFRLDDTSVRIEADKDNAVAGSKIKFKIDNSEIGFFDENGHLDIDGNLVVASGQGIDFSATSGTGTSELFDDYEEGTWTPDVQDTSGNSASTSSAAGAYTKVGDLVTAFMRIVDVNKTGLTAGDAIRVYGLPYTGIGTTRYGGSAIINTWTGTTGLITQVIGGNTYAQFKTSSNGNALVSEITSGSADIYAQVTYKV